MLVELLGLVAATLLSPAAPGRTGFSAAALLPDISFRPRERAVSNWRFQAARHLDASPGTAAAILLGRDPASVTRCVRLNNYWCIKRAGWAGEIAADAEGHVAFASAEEGADVAALLLRRYYVDYGRRSAFAIVSHWAPPSCGVAGPRGVSGGARTAADHLATHGLGHTLRARFLAARGRRVAGRSPARRRRSVIPDRLIGRTMPAPAIAVGLGESVPVVSLGTQSLASLPLTAMVAGSPSRPATAGLACTGDGARIRAYALKTAAGVAASPDADLHLFDADGRPTPNLARVMNNMAAVEIGPLGADRALVAAAVEHAAALARTAASAKAAAR